MLLVMKRFGLDVHLRWKRGRPWQSCEGGLADDGDKDGRRWHEGGVGMVVAEEGVESFVLLTGGTKGSGP